MKKCPYCGTEYPNDAVRCVTDNELLVGDEVVEPASPAAVLDSTPIASLPAAVFTDRQMRIIEVVLVCTVAFGSAIIFSTYSFFSGYDGGSGRSALTWTVQGFREASALGLVWYVLARQKRSFADLGLKWKGSDFGWGILLIVAGSLAHKTVYAAIYDSGLTAASHEATNTRVGIILFGGGISVATLLFQFLNPFFEELIVRAYLMTEIKHLTNSASMAILTSTVLQTSYHFYQGAPAAFAHGATFLIFSIFYAKTGRIAPPILAHLYSDVGGTLLYLFRH